VVLALSDRQSGGWAVALAGTVLAVIGLVVVVWPGPSIAFLAFLAGVAIVLFGFAMVAQGFRLRGG